MVDHPISLEELYSGGTENLAFTKIMGIVCLLSVRAPGISAYPPNHFWASCGPISMKLTSKKSPLQGPFKFIGVQK